MIVSKSVNNGRVRLAGNPRTYDLGTVHELKNCWDQPRQMAQVIKQPMATNTTGKNHLSGILHKNNQPLRGQRRSDG